MKTANTPEHVIDPSSGWPILFTWLAILGPWIWISVRLPFGFVLAPLFILVLPGFYIVNPNIGRVLVLFGRYKGTVRENGFKWTNPFMVKHVLSLRAHNLDGSILKVNDLMGNPIELSAVVVWRVKDTARAQFDVEDYAHFVRVQSDAAVRQVASKHPYDEGMTDTIATTLRGSTEEVMAELQAMLVERLSPAGIEVIEARLNHLAYAQEIASAMLQRQQAKAIVAARTQIVDGAVGMVEMALNRLNAENVIELDEERKATLVGNLLVVLCGHTAPSPVLNTGSLYN